MKLESLFKFIFPKYHQENQAMKKQLYEIKEMPRVSYRESIDIVETWLKEKVTTDEKIDLISVVMELIREDLRTSSITKIFYNEKHFNHQAEYYIFPQVIYDKEMEAITPEGLSVESKEVDLTTDCVITRPWDRQRLVNSIDTIFAEEFRYKKHDHEVWFYSDVEIADVRSGNHSIAAGIIHKNGKIPSKIIDLKLIFPHVYTDGVRWFETHTDRPYSGIKVSDFRIAILYTLAKMKHELINN